VLGLLPLILEQSFQAKFLIPMAISIAGGLISATVIVLVVLPCFMLVFDDVRRLGHFLWHGVWPPRMPITEGVGNQEAQQTQKSAGAAPA